MRSDVFTGALEQARKDAPRSRTVADSATFESIHPFVVVDILGNFVARFSNLRCAAHTVVNGGPVFRMRHNSPYRHRVPLFVVHEVTGLRMGLAECKQLLLPVVTVS